jgi:phage repressor protein C with HTH and peptisase S24 domain
MNTKSDAAAPLPPEREPFPEGEAIWHTAALLESERDALHDTVAFRLGERLREARRSRPRTWVAALLGLHENTIGKFERGENMPDAFQLCLLAQVLECSVLWLLGIDPGARRDDAAQRQTEAVEQGDHVFVPHFDVYASAGHGGFDQVETVKAMSVFRTDYLRNELGIPHNRVALVNVMGTSMEPSIHSGDVVLVDRQDTGVAIEGAYLVRIDGSLLVKLLQRLPGGRIRVASKNETYPPFEVDINKDGRDFEVLGRVRWAGVTFR